MAVVFSNNATTVLSSNITNSATSIAVADGSVFPALSGVDYFYATLQDPSNTKREIVKVTARSGNTLTVTRAVDGSSASAFSTSDIFELRLNAAALNDAVNSGTADLELNLFTGDGSAVAFTLSTQALEANTLAYIDGVYQNKSAYSISGYVLTFSAAPDNGAAIEVTAATVAPIQESTDFLLNQFTGDGSDVTFTLSSSPLENQTTVYVSGVYQSKSSYSVSGTTLTFSTAPPNSAAIEVMVARTVVYAVGTPANNTVTTAKIVDDAVTSAKLSNALSTKIDGIEASADVTTASKIQTAGGLLDSELTSIVAVKALNQGVATGDSPDFAALNVDGTATVDGLTVSSSTSTNATFVNGVGTGMQLTLADQGWSAGINQNAGSLYLQSGGLTNRLGIASNGDISFYEPTGNAKFFWDASAESLGIGTSSPSASLHVSASPEIVTRLSRSAGSNSLVLFEDPTTTLAPYIGSYGNAMAFGRYGGGESMRIDSSGTVLVGTTSAGSAGAGDIVVSGGVYLGGTGAANRLDSYETGNWTPSFNYGGLSSALGTYTKIGNLVTLKMYVTFNVAGSTSNFMNIAGFPFAINSSAVNYGPSTVMMDNLSTAYNNVVIQPSVGSSSAIFIVNNLSTSTHSGMQASNFTASTSVRATIIYTTDS